MKEKHSHGSINTMVLVNIALAVIITLAVSFLFSANMQQVLSTSANASNNTANNYAATSGHLAEPGTQNEIESLKASLEKENARLKQLLAQEALVEQYRLQAQSSFATP